MPGTANSGGRNAKSPSEHRAQGTFQKCRHDGFEVPDPPKGRPEPAKNLKGAALAAWLQMVDFLEHSKTLSIVDGAALYQYAQLCGETEALAVNHERVQKISSRLMTEARRLKGNELVEAIQEIVKLEFIFAKQVTQLRQQHIAVKQYLVEFGMTTVSRNRVKIQKGEDRPASKLVSFRGGRAAAPNTETK